MAVRIRLSRVGATKRPSYRVVVIDSRRPRDGRALEIIGFYDPLTDPATVRIDPARVDAWVAKGATPSDTVARLIKLAADRAAGTAEPTKAATPRAAAKPTRARKAAAKPAAEAAKPDVEAAKPAAEADEPAVAVEGPSAEAAGEAAATPEAAEAAETAEATE